MTVGAKMSALRVMTKVVGLVYDIFKAITEVLFTHTHEVKAF